LIFLGGLKIVSKKILYDGSSSQIITNFDTTDAHIEVHYSGINYKDALGVTGRGPIFKTTPIVPGIDFSGKALKGKFKGKYVIAQGSGFGESFDGGYTTHSFCDDEHLIELPDGLSPKESMTLGTAGFTAALAVHRMLSNNLKSSDGPVLVSGATGGVGSFAIQILKKLGFEVHALTHRLEHKDYLNSLGSDEVFEPDELFKEKAKPLEKATWAGVVDNLGGDFLSSVLPRIKPWGVLSSIGIAKGSKLETTVMPFILRGVSLLGASSTNCPMDLRKELWSNLASDWKPSKITELIASEVNLEEVLDSSHKILDHKSQPGRVLVNLKGE
jgi:NADPH2:quinone reductase